MDDEKRNITREYLEGVAATITAIDGGLHNSVELWDSLDLLAELGAEMQATVYLTDDAPGPHVIEQARLEFGNVRFQSQRARPATAEEIERAEAIGGGAPTLSYRVAVTL